jgi:hypothetical protein
LFRLLQVLELLLSFVLPDKKDFEFGASYGLVSLQDYQQLDAKLMAKGIFKDISDQTCQN